MNDYQADAERGTGRTTQQLKNAPQGALFIWCTHHIDYPTRLCRTLKREDITIVTDSILERPERLFGREFTALIVDHAVKFNTERFHNFERIKAVCRILNNN